MKRIHIRPYLNRLKKKFRLTIFNESTLENFFSLRASLMDGLFMIASLFIVFFIISLLLIIYTPLRNLLPKDMDPNMRKSLVQQALRVDSMANTLELQAQYLKVVNAIISGDLPVDSIQNVQNKQSLDSGSIKKLKLMTATEGELEFRDAYEETEKYNLSILDPGKTEKQWLFHPPLRGRIITTFNPKLGQHGIQMDVSGMQPCVAVSAGTVLFAGYTSDFEYVIQIQHSNDFVSVYKNNTEILKKQGDEVRSGEAIGMVGGRSAKTGKIGLIFELWQKGIALNPEEYIVF